MILSLLKNTLQLYFVWFHFRYLFLLVQTILSTYLQTLLSLLWWLVQEQELHHLLVSCNIGMYQIFKWKTIFLCWKKYSLRLLSRKINLFLIFFFWKKMVWVFLFVCLCFPPSSLLNQKGQITNVFMSCLQLCPFFSL